MKRSTVFVFICGGILLYCGMAPVKADPVDSFQLTEPGPLKLRGLTTQKSAPPDHLKRPDHAPIKLTPWTVKVRGKEYKNPGLVFSATPPYEFRFESRVPYKRDFPASTDRTIEYYLKKYSKKIYRNKDEPEGYLLGVDSIMARNREGDLFYRGAAFYWMEESGFPLMKIRFLQGQRRVTGGMVRPIRIQTPTTIRWPEADVQIGEVLLENCQLNGISLNEITLRDLMHMGRQNVVNQEGPITLEGCTVKDLGLHVTVEESTSDDVDFQEEDIGWASRTEFQTDFLFGISLHAPLFEWTLNEEWKRHYRIRLRGSVGMGYQYQLTIRQDVYMLYLKGGYTDRLNVPYKGHKQKNYLTYEASLDLFLGFGHVAAELVTPGGGWERTLLILSSGLAW